MSSLTLGILLLTAPARALNLSQDVGQYGHTTWTLRDSVLPGYPKSMAQTADGYLWLATEFGLLRFDGVRFVPWSPPAGSPLPSDVIVKVLATRDGSLWIGTSKGLARWTQGALTTYAELEGQAVFALAGAREGTVWAGTNGGPLNAKLCAIQSSGRRCYGSDGTLGRFVLSLYEDGSGNLWVGAATGLWRWKPPASTVFPVRYPFPEIHEIIGSANGSPLIAINREVKQLVDGQLATYPLDAGPELKPTSLLRDRNGGLWIGTQDTGVVHVHQGRIDRFTRSDGLSGDFVVSLLEDREGNVWVGTLNGLDRFRDVVATRISTRQGLSNDTVMSVLSSGDGSVWLGTVGGLDRWKDGRIKSYAMPVSSVGDGVGSLFQDSRGRIWVSSRRGLSYLTPERGWSEPVRGLPTRYIDAMAEDEERNLWISDRGRGLFRLRDASIAELIPWSTFGGDFARALVLDGSGGIWLGFARGGIAYFSGGRVLKSYSAADGLAGGQVNGLHLDRDGALWVAAQGGLTRIEGDRIQTLRSGDGLPCDTVQWAIEDDARALWLHTACGVARVVRRELDEWLVNPQRRVRLTVYDKAEGVLRYSDLGSYSPKVTKATDGRLWFATYDGVGVIDPTQLPFNTVVPSAHIEQVTGDGTIYDATPQRRLPALVRDLRIEYTAVSLVAPEKVRFRYKLEGRDRDWVDAADRRQAFYTDLAPGPYRFRVTAANDQGIWNEAGAAWDFSMAPAFYQTNTFRAIGVLLAILALSVGYRVRVRRLATELNVRFEERLAERTRIAQELHDTLLQGFAGTSMQLHAMADAMTDYDARPKLTRILGRMSEVLEEGRQAVTGLRSFGADDLDRALARDAEHFRGDQSVDIHVSVSGERRPLHPLVRDTISQIGREALANAFRHARAKRVEIEIEYASDDLRVRLRDDGCGIEPDIVESGRSGHWGLRGMRERTERIGGTLKLWSRVSLGTEVELTVPARIAFLPSPSRRTRHWRRRG